MLERLTGWFRLLWDAGEKLNQQSATIDDLQTNDRHLLQAMQALVTRVELLQKDNEMLREQLQHERERRGDELEKIELRLRLQLSEELRRLPPAPDQTE